MIIGIDLGTTNSAAAVFRGGAPELIPNSLGDFLTPSAISMADDGSVLVGMAARERQSTHPKQTATAFKRLMGTRQQIRLGKDLWSAEDLSSLVLKSLVADAEAFLGEAVEGAVITVPAYFNDKQRKATRRAGELAGLHVERLINEPTAAALSYGIHERELEEPFLIFDLGGGTFDVSLVEMFDGIIEVRASAGDNRLGGEDFNDLMIELVREKWAEDAPKGGDPQMLTEVLRAAAERARRALTEADSANFKIIWQGKEFNQTVSEEAYEQKAAGLLSRLREPVLRSLRDSNTKVEEISEIVMVGGTTRMPIVRRAVARMFKRFPNFKIHPDHAVALGAAVQAGLRARDADLKEVRLTDVCPFTLGVETSEPDGRGGFIGGLFAPIIERNTVIPTSKVRSFSPGHETQTQVEFKVYQGEARQVDANVKLGSVTIKVPPKKPGEALAEVNCRFSYDTSGLLEVDVTVPETGITSQLVIYDEEDSKAGDLAARRDALAKLKFHPRESAENAAAMARAQRCFENFLGLSRDMISQSIGNFVRALATQDARTIDAARTVLNEQLDYLEGDRFL